MRCPRAEIVHCSAGNCTAQGNAPIRPPRMAAHSQSLLQETPLSCRGRERSVDFPPDHSQLDMDTTNANKQAELVHGCSWTIA